MEEDSSETQYPFLVRRPITRNQTALIRTMEKIGGDLDARPAELDAKILALTKDDNIRTRNKLNDTEIDVILKQFDKQQAEKKKKKLQAQRERELRALKNRPEDNEGHEHGFYSTSAAVPHVGERKQQQHGGGHRQVEEEPTTFGSGDGIPTIKSNPTEDEQQQLMEADSMMSPYCQQAQLDKESVDDEETWLGWVKRVARQELLLSKEDQDTGNEPVDEDETWLGWVKRVVKQELL